MKTGKRGSPWGRYRPAARLAGLALLCAACLGCAADRAAVEKNLRTDPPDGPRGAGVSEQYLVGCPDVLEVELPHKAELSGEYTVGPDGRIDLGDYGKLRVEGRPLAEVARRLAAETGADPAAVKVRVAEYRSQPIFLFGQVIGWQRAVPYRGQETVLDLLQRVGGITPGAAPSDVYVARPHVGESGRPEVFHVDLAAIVLRHDERTNLRLLPYDQVYVGETRQAVVARVVPPWLRPLYQAVSNTRPDPYQAADPNARSPWVTGKE